jgi:hypothetical protein
MPVIKVKHISVGTEIKDDAEWTKEDLHTLEVEEGAVIVSNPPSGGYKIFNMWLEKVGSKYKIMFDIENIPIP